MRGAMAQAVPFPSSSLVPWDMPPDAGSFVKRGTTLFVEHNLLSVIRDDPDVRPFYCSYCFKNSSGNPASLMMEGAELAHFFSCSRCKYVHYCTLSCQDADWKYQHKYECPTLIRALSASQTTDLTSLHRWRLLSIYMRKRRATIQQHTHGGIPPPGYTEVPELDTRLPSYIDEDKVQNQLLADFFTSRESYGALVAGLTSNVRELFALYTAIRVRMVPVCDFAGVQTIGFGLPLTLMRIPISRACLGNTVVQYLGRTLYLRNIQDLPEFSWPAVTLSLDQCELTLLVERRLAWKEGFRKPCECLICSNESIDLQRFSVSCPACETGCVPLTVKVETLPCVQCKEATEIQPSQVEDYKSAHRKSMAMFGILKNRLKAHHIIDLGRKLVVSDVELCKQVLAAQMKARMHPLHVYRVRFELLTCLGMIANQMFADAYTLAPGLVRSFRHYLSPCHPLLTTMLFISWKLLALDLGRNNLEAKEYLIQVIEQTEVSAGSFNPLRQDFLLTLATDDVLASAPVEPLVLAPGGSAEPFGEPELATSKFAKLSLHPQASSDEPMQGSPGVRDSYPVEGSDMCIEEPPVGAEGGGILEELFWGDPAPEDIEVSDIMSEPFWAEIPEASTSEGVELPRADGNEPEMRALSAPCGGSSDAEGTPV